MTEMTRKIRKTENRVNFSYLKFEPVDFMLCALSQDVM